MHVQKLAVLLHVLHLDSYLADVVPLFRVDVLSQNGLIPEFLDDSLQLAYLLVLNSTVAALFI